MANIAKLAAKLTADDRGFIAPVARAAKAMKGLWDRASKSRPQVARQVDPAKQAERAAVAMAKQAAAADKLAGALAFLVNVGQRARRVARALELIGASAGWAARRMERLASATAHVGRRFAAMGQRTREVVKATHAAEQLAAKEARAAQAAKTAEKHHVSIGRALFAVKAAVVAAGVALTTGYIGQVIDGEVATLRFARRLGTTAASVNGLREAVRQTGGDVDTANRALVKLADSLQGAVTGDAGRLDAFARLGVDAAKLAGMDPAAAFRAVADALSKIEDRERRAALAVRIFGGDAAELMAVFNRGAAGIDKAAQMAERFGRALTDDEIGDLEKGNVAFGRIEENIKGVVGQLAVRLLPAVNEAIKSFDGMGGAAAGVTEVVTAGLGYVATGVGYAVDGFDALTLAVKATELGFVRTGIAATHVFESVTVNVLRSADVLGVFTDELDHLAAVAGNTRDEFRGWRDGIVGRMDELVDGFGRGAEKAAEFARFMERAKRHADGAGKAWNALQDPKGTEAAGKLAKLYERVSDTTREMQTPLEKFNSRMADLNAQLDKGGLAWEVYARAVSAAVGELESAHSLTRMGFSEAASAGSVKAYSQALASTQQENLRNRESPQDRILRIQRESLEIEKRQEQYQKQIADAQRNAPKVARLGGA